MGGQVGFLYRQLTFKPKPILSSVNLEGKTAIITGANVGLGLEAAKELAAHGLTCLILAARSITKGEAAKKEILENSPNCVIQVWELDYDSFDSIRSFGERAQTLDRLDLVILSAGVKYLEYIKSNTGHEAHVQVGNPPLKYTRHAYMMKVANFMNIGKPSGYRRSIASPSPTASSDCQIYRNTKQIDYSHIRGAFLD